MIYVRQPTDAESAELRRMTRQAVGRVSQRAHMVLLSAQRRAVPEIARIFEVSRATVRYWLRQFDAEGPAGLYDEPRSGRPPKVSREVTDAMTDMLRHDPRQEGYLATFWTVAMLVLALVNRLGVLLSASTVRRHLQQLGLRWGRPRLAMPDKVDPRKAAKQWAIAQAVIDAGPEANVLYADESRVQLLPLVRAMWHWAGCQIRVPTPGTNVSRTLFGALNIRSGRWTYLVRQRAASEDFVAFGEQYSPYRWNNCWRPIPAGRSSWWLTTSAVMRRVRSKPGWCSIPGCNCTSCQSTARISTLWRMSGSDSRVTWLPIGSTAPWP